MINIKNNIKQILDPLLIYDLKEGSMTDKEISVYSKFLQSISDKIDELLNESIIQTAKSYGLSNKLMLLPIKIGDNDSLNTQRQKLINMLSLSSNNFNKTDIITVLKSIGLECDIIENKKEETITVSSKNKDIDQKEVKIFKELLSKMLPAHLDIIFDIGRPASLNDLNDTPIDIFEEITLDNLSI